MRRLADPLYDPAILAWKTVDCAACRRRYLARLPAATDEGVLFHCADCPGRVRVRIDDPFYLRAMGAVAGYTDSPLTGSRAHWRAIQGELEAALEGCACGGRHRFDAVRRCWGCAAPLLTVPSPWWSHLPSDRVEADLTRPARWRVLGPISIAVAG